MNTNFVRCKIALALCILTCITLIVSGCNKESEPVAPQNQNPFKIQNPFIGTWRLIEVRYCDGYRFPSRGCSPPVMAYQLGVGDSWNFDESTVAIPARDQTFTGSYSFDQTKNPKTMNLAGLLAIYDFPSSSSLRIKVGAYVRATNFNVEPGYVLLEFAKQ